MPLASDLSVGYHRELRVILGLLFDTTDEVNSKTTDYRIMTIIIIIIIIINDEVVLFLEHRGEYHALTSRRSDDARLCEVAEAAAAVGAVTTLPFFSPILFLQY